jgi:phosphoribosylanthranilate isomerase
LKKVKVCGLTRAEDVSLAVDLGADLLGFVLASSPRSVTLERLTKLVEGVPATVLTVAVVVNPDEQLADQLLSVTDRIQLHGQETPDFCARYGRRAIKAFRIRAVEDLQTVSAYRNSVGAFLLDSFKEGVAGGTGETFPWTYLKRHRFPLPTFLAGGLNPDNVADAGELPQIGGVDVSSGLEASPGVKDPELMRDFFQRAKGGPSLS